MTKLFVLLFFHPCTYVYFIVVVVNICCGVMLLHCGVVVVLL